MRKIDKSIRKIHIIPPSCHERYLPLDNPAAEIMTTAGLTFSGISKLHLGYQVGYGAPYPDYMVIFTTAGEGYLATEKHEYPLLTGTVLVTSPGEEFIFGVENDRWDIVWFYFRAIDRWQQLHHRGVWLRETDTTKVEMVTEWLLAELQLADTQSGNLVLAQNYSRLLLSLLEQTFEISPLVSNQEDINVRLGELINRIQNSLDRKWTIQEMADFLKLTPITTQRLIKKHYQTTARQLLIRLRISQAELLLKNTNYPLKIIADQLGYADEFVFSSAFKHSRGVSPKTYRETISN